MIDDDDNDDHVERGLEMEESEPKAKPDDPSEPYRTQGDEDPVTVEEIVVETLMEKTESTRSRISLNDEDQDETRSSDHMSTDSITSHLAVSPADVQLLTQLYREYRNALEGKQIAFIAKQHSLRQTALIVIPTVLLQLAFGITFVTLQANVSVDQAALFCMYTFTSAGFGNVVIPKTNGFLSFAVMYVYLGISSVAILFAQVFQSLQYEAGRLQHRLDKAQFAQQGLHLLQQMVSRGTQQKNDITDDMDQKIRLSLINAMSLVPQATSYTTEHRFGYKSIISLARQSRLMWTFIAPLFLMTLLLIGTFTMMGIEGWSFVEALYFSTFAMTTVGYGDLAPTKQSSTIFVVFWLPFNMLFMAVFLNLIAHHFINFSNACIQKREKKLKYLIKNADMVTPLPSESMEDTPQQVQLQPKTSFRSNEGVAFTTKEKDGKNQGDSNASSSQGAANSRSSQNSKRSAPPSKSDFSNLFRNSPGKQIHGPKRRKLIKEKSMLTFDDLASETFEGGVALGTTQDLLQALQVSSDSGSVMEALQAQRSPQVGFDVSHLLRQFRVSERVALIIASDVAGLQSEIEIRGNMLQIKTDALKEIMEKWLVPLRARKTFREVCFESIFFVGEHDLLLRGTEVFYDLNPFQFCGLFGQFAAALDDPVTMDGWLASTDILAATQQREMTLVAGKEDSEVQLEGVRRQNRISLTNPIEGYFPVNPGNAILTQV